MARKEQKPGLFFPVIDRTKCEVCNPMKVGHLSGAKWASHWEGLGGAQGQG